MADITDELGNPTNNPAADTSTETTTDTSGTPTAEQKQKDFENKAGVIDESVLLDDSKVINSEGLSNTGAGAKAAEGTQYSWDKKATEKADLQYQKDILDEKQKLLQNRQQIQENATKYQTETDMSKYQENQTIDKLGWTGGYVLDSVRQQDYLKQSTQAQLYGAMELQKYGYDTSLAAARLAYDMNQQDYALEYYNQAQSVAMQEGQLLGKYMSAEAKEMLDNYNTAKLKIDSGNYTEDDERIFKATEQWFERNQVSKEGIRTLAAIESYRENYKALMEDRWAKYQSILETTKQGLASGEVVMYDENGNPLYNGAQIQTFNLNTASGDEIKKYLEECDYNTNALTTVRTWLQQTIFDTVSQNAQKDSEGNYIAPKSTIEKVVSSALNSKISKLDPSNENINSLLTNLDYGALGEFGVDEITVKYNAETKNFDVTAKTNTGAVAITVEDGLPDLTADTNSLWNKTYSEGKTFGDYVTSSLIADGAKTAEITGKTQKQIESELRSLSNDVDANKEGHNGYDLITAYANAIANNKIPNGSIIKLNYGTDSKDIDYYLYKDGKLTQLKFDSTYYVTKTIYASGGLVKVPEGYTINDSYNVVYQ